MQISNRQSFSSKNKSTATVMSVRHTANWLVGNWECSMAVKNEFRCKQNRIRSKMRLVIVNQPHENTRSMWPLFTFLTIKW